jgi:hypothetical protein
VYKRLPDVLAAHGDTIRVKHTLRPLGVAMAGRDVHDPYKDRRAARAGREMQRFESVRELEKGPAVCGSASDIADVSRER